MDITRIKYIDIRSTLTLLLNRINNVRAYGKTFLKINKKSKIKGQGILILNSNFERACSRPSNITVMNDAEIITNGVFSMFYGADIIVYPHASLVIGSGYSNINLLIRCKKKVEIGNNVKIAHDVVIMDSDFHEYEIEGVKNVSTKPVIIEDNVWIGEGVKILKGVTIGEGAIIGAGSVVNKSIGAHVLAVGNPCKVIKTNVNVLN